jgi:signal transduction histidine kinase/ligand-binding sensor domain-containing protein
LRPALNALQYLFVKDAVDRISFALTVLRRLKFILALCACLLGWANPVLALDPSMRLDALYHDIWREKEGAPREIEAMAQTADGWLWLGTTSGLYRFDGVSFTPFAPRDGGRLLGASITVLLPRANGELWIGYTLGGLSVVRDGRFEHVAPKPGEPIGATFALAFDAEDSLWVASSSGLFRYRDGRLERIGADWGFPGNYAEYVYHDHYGRLWASDGKQIFLLDRAAGRFAPVMATTRYPMLLASNDGRIWALAGNAMQVLPAPPGGWRPRPESRLRSSSFQSLFDRDGNFWNGNCPVGLCRIFPATWQRERERISIGKGEDRFDRPWQMSSLNVHSMMEDREGNLWVGTIAGVERLRPNKLRHVPFDEQTENAYLVEDGDGVLWAATTGMDDLGKLWQVRDGVPVAQESDQKVYLVAPGKDGSVLLGGGERIERRRGERMLATYPLPARGPNDPTRNFVAMVADDGDALWVAIGGRGLFRWQDGVWHPPAAHPQIKGPTSYGRDARGRMWFGLRNNRLLLRAEDGRWHAFGEEEGIKVGPVRFIDMKHELVIAGDFGAAVLRGNRFHPLLADRPELLAGLSGLAVTLDGDRWLNTVRGLVHVRAEDWRRAMRDPRVPLRTTVWNGLDGYPGSAETVSRGRTALVARDGKVWIVTTEGLAWFDRRQLWRNTEAPAVEVLAVHADGVSYRPRALASFPSGTEQLQFDYTALSYTMPERVRFRYRLVGLDHHWQEVGARRSAYYTNLGPGNYRFEVGAVNEDGVASAVASTPEFAIRPHFWQTAWFALLCASAGALAAWLLYRLRMRQVQRQFQARLRERLHERERIARTLHDTFLQSLQGLVLRLQSLALRMEAGSPMRRELDSALDLADKVIAEGRDQVMDLRLDEAVPSLAQALAEAADMLKEGSSVRVAVRTEGACVQLPCALHLEVFHIAREAIANAVRHARASLIEIDLRCEGRELLLAVRDDGIGLDPQVQESGRPGHWGLVGMRERADKIGARLAIRNRPGRGTEVVLRLADIAPLEQEVAEQGDAAADKAAAGS